MKKKWWYWRSVLITASLLTACGLNWMRTKVAARKLQKAQKIQI